MGQGLSGCLVGATRLLCDWGGRGSSIKQEPPGAPAPPQRASPLTPGGPRPRTFPAPFPPPLVPPGPASLGTARLGLCSAALPPGLWSGGVPSGERGGRKPGSVGLRCWASRDAQAPAAESTGFQAGVGRALRKGWLEVSITLSMFVFVIQPRDAFPSICPHHLLPPGFSKPFGTEEGGWELGLRGG